MSILKRLQEEKNARLRGKLYHKTQIDFCYNTNHIEGSKLTHEQTRFIFETNTIGGEKTVKVDDIIETANHFRAFDFMLETIEKRLSEELIKEFHKVLKQSTSDSYRDWFAVDDYKKLPNEIAGNPTTAPEQVAQEMQKLLTDYHGKKEIVEKFIVNGREN